MIDTHLQATYQNKLITPLIKKLPLQHVSPNLVTLTAFLLGISTLPLLSFQHPYIALSALLLSGFLDTVDGSLARLQKNSSPKGAALDLTSDRCVEAAIILGLFAQNPDQRAWPCLTMLTSVLICVTTFLIAGIFQANNSSKSFHYSPGWIERAEAFLFFSLMILLPSLFTPLSITFSTLVTLTGLLRLRQLVAAF